MDYNFPQVWKYAHAVKVAKVVSAFDDFYSVMFSHPGLASMATILAYVLHTSGQVCILLHSHLPKPM